MKRNLFMYVVGLVLMGVFFCMASPLQAQMNRNNQLPGQYPGLIPGQQGFPQNEGEDEDLQTKTKADTTKKVRKPLESYFFNDSIRKGENFVWTIDTYRNILAINKIDSAILYSQFMDYPYLKEDVGDNYLGNLGGASTPLNYARRPDYRDFHFTEGYYAYWFKPENVPFYNVKKPFTQLTSFSAGQKIYLEESLGVIHAQSISPSTGFNVNYKTRGTRGIYKNAGGRNKSLSLAFDHTGKKYTAHAGYIFNMAELKENGGVVSDSLITGDDGGDKQLPQNISVNLRDARNKMRNNTYYVVQTYGVPLRKLTEDDFSIADQSSFFLGHAFEYSRLQRKYLDSKTESGDFYKDWFIDPQITKDSLFESRLSNRVFIQLQPWDRNGIIGTIDAGVGVDKHHYFQFNPAQYTSGRSNGDDRTMYYAYGSVEGYLKKYLKWGADIKYHPLGDRSQDIYIGANASVSAYFKGHPVTLSGKFSNDTRTPGYWSDSYFSNHYVWSNSFRKENETRLEASLEIPDWGTELRLTQSVVVDKIYYDSNCKPAQSSESVSVTGLYAKQDFRFGGFHLNHRVLLQLSTAQDVIPVPLTSAYLSYFFEFNVVKDVLRMQIGFDGRLNTKYYAVGYNPAIAHFYNQKEKEIGGYPMIDVFAAAKWKRMRIILKIEHLNYNMGTREFFSVLHHPLNKRVMKLGVSWNFYD